MRSVAAKAERQVRRIVWFCGIGRIFFTRLGASPLAAWEDAHLQSDPGKNNQQDKNDNMTNDGNSTTTTNSTTAPTKK